MSNILITKNNTKFYVEPNYANWFISEINNGNWEESTFNILDYYSNINKLYIDIGAWIGPTVLYSADKYEQIICFEPDHVAYNILSHNISINKFNNIILINKAISDNIGSSEFGGYGEFGNSMSSLLVNIKNNIDKQHLTNINTTTLEKIIEEYKIDVNNIALIKMDIEGGEIFVIPNIKDFLLKYKPNFYISLHWGDQYLNPEQVSIIVNLLFDIYEDNCYVFLEEKNTVKKKINREEVLVDLKYSGLVFEKKI